MGFSLKEKVGSIFGLSSLSAHEDHLVDEQKRMLRLLNRVTKDVFPESRWEIYGNVHRNPQGMNDESYRLVGKKNSSVKTELTQDSWSKIVGSFRQVGVREDLSHESKLEVTYLSGKVSKGYQPFVEVSDFHYLGKDLEYLESVEPQLKSALDNAFSRVVSSKPAVSRQP